MNKKQWLELLVMVIKQLADVPNLLWLLVGEGPTKVALFEGHSGAVPDARAPAATGGAA
jgi:hypothetical protein